MIFFDNFVTEDVAQSQKNDKQSRTDFEQKFTPQWTLVLKIPPLMTHY